MHPANPGLMRFQYQDVSVDTQQKRIAGFKPEPLTNDYRNHNPSVVIEPGHDILVFRDS
ncbi:hypothetical protein SBA5_620015 [Candidatus Sulfotelmatomonas gaucii]|uniref:Uncharacterized protein n=1 Tax=Candidatus Sulfuritelmatomonas gaucii TaxID=2043161 RepID=A0A2N9LXR8_9BACT|nr:hypothetical protein SBA5_620015 [Candidatus Sulfotelmatomonas gaucii]